MIKHLVGTLMAILICVSSSSTQAQERHPHQSWIGHEDAVLLARTCWSEAGAWEDGEFSRIEDCAAIAEVIRYIMERDGVTFRQAWRAASPHLAVGDIERTWLSYLNAAGTRPRGFRLSWRVYRPLWLNLLDLARAILRNDIASSCVEQPFSWGNRSDIRIGRRRGRSRWIEVECGDTANHFGRWELL